MLFYEGYDNRRYSQNLRCQAGEAIEPIFGWGAEKSGAVECGESFGTR
jgi:hypothetical protein